MTIEVLGAGSDVTFFSVGAGVRLGFSVRHVACCGWRARDLLRQRASSLSLRDALAPHPGSCGASLVTWQRERCEVVRGDQRDPNPNKKPPSLSWRGSFV